MTRTAALTLPALAVLVTTGNIVGAALAAALTVLFGVLALAARHWNDDEPDAGEHEAIAALYPDYAGTAERHARIQAAADRCRKNEGGF